MMADALSDNFCSLCGSSFFRFGSENLNIKTSLASAVVEDSGLLIKLNIALSPLKKELVFICYACRNVFVNYNAAKANFEHREKQALILLTGPVEADDKGQLPFVPYLKRKCLLGSNSEVQQARPPKIQKLDDSEYSSQYNNISSEHEDQRKLKLEPKEELPTLPPDTNNLEENKDGIKPTRVRTVRQESMAFVERGRYKSALEKLWKNSKRFRQCCRSLVSLVVRRETRNLLKHRTLFTKKIGGMYNLGDVCWQSTMDIASQVAPTTLGLLSALLGHKSGSTSMAAERSNHNIIGCLLSQALYKRFKRQASFLPQLHSLYLHQLGTSPQVNKALHPLGLTVPSFRLAAILKESEAFQEEQAIIWKRDLEAALAGIHKAEPPPRKFLHTEKRKERSEPTRSTQVTSYGLCWGRILPGRISQDIQCVASPPSNSEDPHRTTVGVQNPALAQAYAARNRIPFTSLPKHNEIRAADNIPFDEFVPDSEDFLRVRVQMELEVQKILVKYIPAFNELSVTERHRHSDVTSKTSCIIEVGRPFHHPTDNGSAASALKRLAGHMGQVEEELVPLVVFGGRGTVERAVGAKDVMSCFSDKADRLDGLEPAITDHGRNVLMARDIINMFFPGDLTKEEGVLQHLRINSSLLKKCQTTSNATTLHSFLDIVAHNYTVTLGEEKLAGVRTGKLSMCADEKKKILERIAADIVADVWPRIDTDSLDIIRQGNEPVKDRECCYEDCVNYNEMTRVACSERCGRPLYLCCRTHLNEGLVECGRRENCRRGAWFHLNRRCSGLLKAPRDDWLCRWCTPRRGVSGSNNGEAGEEEEAWEYHRSLLWYCLFLLVGRTAESQGNGWLQHAVWKVCMPLFETRGHTHYLQQGYSFLSGVAGRIPRLAAHDMVHNRTINLRGGPSSNLSWDRAVNLLNRERRWASNEAGVSSSKVPGFLAYSIRTAWERDICNVSKPGQENHLNLVPNIASHLYTSNTLHTLLPPPGTSRHNGHIISVKDPQKMLEKLRELCHQDATRQMNEREGEVLE